MESVWRGSLVSAPRKWESLLKTPYSGVGGGASMPQVIAIGPFFYKLKKGDSLSRSDFPLLFSLPLQNEDVGFRELQHSTHFCFCRKSTGLRTSHTSHTISDRANSWATSVKLFNLSKPQFPQLQNMDLDYTFYTVIFVATKWNTMYGPSLAVSGGWDSMLPVEGVQSPSLRN